MLGPALSIVAGLFLTRALQTIEDRARHPKGRP